MKKREGETETERQTDRQTERQTQTQTQSIRVISLCQNEIFFHAKGEIYEVFGEGHGHMRLRGHGARLDISICCPVTRLGVPMEFPCCRRFADCWSISHSFLSPCLSLSLSACLSVSVSVCVSVCLRVCLSSTNPLSLSLSLCLSLSLSLRLNVCL